MLELLLGSFEVCGLKWIRKRGSEVAVCFVFKDQSVFTVFEKMQIKLKSEKNK